MGMGSPFVVRKARRCGVEDRPVRLRASALRRTLLGGVLAEQTDEWAEGRRYLGLEVLARSRMRVLPNTGDEVVADSFIALSA